MKSTIILAGALTLSVGLTGCASVLDSSSSAHQAIQVTTVPPGAVCTLSNDQGRYNVHTPGVVTVTKTNWPGVLGNKLEVSCVKGALTGVEHFSSLPRGLGWLSGAGGGISAFADRQNGYAYPDVISITLGQ